MTDIAGLVERLEEIEMVAGFLRGVAGDMFHGKRGQRSIDYAAEIIRNVERLEAEIIKARRALRARETGDE